MSPVAPWRGLRRCGTWPPPCGSPDRSRGSVLVPMAAALVVGLILLTSADIGYMAYLKRDLQKSADMAALAGAQRLEQDDPAGACPARVAAAISAIVQTVAWEGVTVAAQRCGQWDPSAGSTPLPADVAGTDANPATWHFTESGAANAVRVTLAAAAPRVAPFLPWDREVRAYAMAATDAPVAAFSVGSQLARMQPDSVLGRVLDQVGVSPQTLTLVDWNGLANLRLKPSGLLAALDIPVAADLTVGGLNALLAAREVSVGEVIGAMAEAVGQGGAAALGLEHLLGVPVPGTGLTLEQLRLTLGSSGATRGLFADIVTPDNAARSALEADLRADDLLSTMLMVAGFDSRVTRRATGVAAGLSALAGVAVEARVVEPPQIGIGGVGTKAYNAQVRLSVDVDTRNIPALSTALGLLGTHVHIPLHLDVVGGEAELMDIQCQGQPRTASIAVTTRILNACLADLPEEQLFSATAACQPSAPSGVLVRLLGTEVVRDLGVPIAGLVHETAAPHLMFEVDEQRPLPQRQAVPASNLPIGTTLAGTSDAVLSLLDQLLAQPSRPSADVARDLADRYLFPPPGSNQRFQLDTTIARLQNGDAASGLPGLGTWTARGAVPRFCGLTACWDDGDVWTGFRRAVDGSGRGVLDGLVGTLLGGLVVNNCSGLTSQILTYNTCVRNNLVSYLQTNPDGLKRPPGGNPLQNCSGLLCNLLSPLIHALAPPLNQLGANLADSVAALTGVELGRTEVELMSLGCHQVRLVQ